MKWRWKRWRKLKGRGGGGRSGRGETGSGKKEEDVEDSGKCLHFPLSWKVEEVEKEWNSVRGRKVRGSRRIEKGGRVEEEEEVGKQGIVVEEEEEEEVEEMKGEGGEWGRGGALEGGK